MSTGQDYEDPTYRVHVCLTNASPGGKSTVLDTLKSIEVIRVRILARILSSEAATWFDEQLCHVNNLLGWELQSLFTTMRQETRTYLPASQLPPLGNPC
jgi:hypothetical protein